MHATGLRVTGLRAKVPPPGAGPADAPAAATPTATGAAAIDNDDGPLDYVADHEENPTR